MTIAGFAARLFVIAAQLLLYVHIFHLGVVVGKIATALSGGSSFVEIGDTAMQILNGSTSPLAWFITSRVKKLSPCVR
ncbi:hypothetical protein [Pseudomonas sp. PDM31]|uniref:hypothetical protein n=1 Tax=Pseudomonas sp. PDM31 TaxID=2854778 RepID=UPI001C446116|nr:hypothetical protein [Pseudomonas sp. PDM31]MBV7479186.1 hypothetical protein [Pseudomonas sp. PDM31]